MSEFELSIKCDIINDYKEAQEESKKGNTVWTIIDKKGKEIVERKLVKLNAVGFLVLRPITEICLFKREKWDVREVGKSFP